MYLYPSDLTGIKCVYYCVMLIQSEKKLVFPVNCELPSSLLVWVTHQDSLTELLQSKARDVRLALLGQRWESPNWWDQWFLQIQSETVLHREIVMWAGNEACWYARTIIPQEAYQSGAALFSRLQKESLGALIFNEPMIKRVYMRYYPISDQSAEYHWLDPSLHCGANVLWVRQSGLIVNDIFPFFLIETLLPALERYST